MTVTFFWRACTLTVNFFCAHAVFHCSSIRCPLSTRLLLSCRCFSSLFALFRAALPTCV